MFGFTPKSRSHDTLEDSEMLSLLGSSVEQEQLSDEMLKLGALSSLDKESEGSFKLDNKPDALGSFVAVDSFHDAQAAKLISPNNVDNAKSADPNLRGLGVSTNVPDNEALAESKGSALLHLKSEHELSALVNIEQVHSDDEPPKAIILDEDSARREDQSQERLDAQVKDILSLKEEKKSKDQFALIGHNLFNVPKKINNLLSDEESECGKIEAEDFITGNVTTINQALRTGTDNLVITASAAVPNSFDSELEKGDAVTHELDLSENKLHCSITLSLHNEEQEPREEPLLPALMREFGENWLTYGLALLVCALCLFKVYQVQDTRDLTARLNEVTVSNADLEKQWLVLVASRQKLSEHSKINTFAIENLQMVSPKSQNENVISLHK